MTRFGRNIVLATVAVTAAAGGRFLFGGDSEEAHAEDLLNHPWLDRLPADERDMIAHLLVLEHPRARVGVVGRSSQWRHFVEVFKWRLEGNQLTAVFPQERSRVQFHVRTWSCEGEAPRPFDLCLEVRRGERRAFLYSREDWVIDPQAPDSSLAELVREQPVLAALAGVTSIPAAADDDEDDAREGGADPLSALLGD
jgi:hypothetical protein